MSSALIAKQTGLVFAGPVGSLDAYIDRVSQIAVLSKEDEVALAARFRSEGDLEAARQLVLSHLRFVVHIARGYLGYGLPMGDLVQEGNVGLMKAVKRFDPGVGVRLVSFAVHWIRAEIHEYVLRNWRLVKVATTKSQRKLFFNLRRMKKNLAWLSEEETRAVARDLGVEEKDVREMEQRVTSPYENALSSLVDQAKGVESHTYDGLVIVKIILRPGADLGRAYDQVAAASDYLRRRFQAAIQPSRDDT